MTQAEHAPRSNELFRDLTNEEFEMLSPCLGDAIVGHDTTLFEENDWADTVYLITQGQVLLKKRLPAHRHGPAHDTVITTCGHGDAVGWSAIAQPHRYSLTATMRGQVTYVPMDTRELDSVLEQSPALAAKVMTSLSQLIARRLRDISEVLIAERMLVIEEARRTR